MALLCYTARYLIYFWFFMLLNIQGTQGSDMQKKLFDNLFETSDYNKLVRPVRDENNNITVSVELYLSQINNVNEKYQHLSMMVWLTQRWKDEYLTWNSSDYDGLDVIRVPASKVWLPDTILYNTRDESSNEPFMTVTTNVIVTNDGNVDWSAPLTIKSHCSVDVYLYPFDKQDCRLKFGSWQHDTRYIDYFNLTSDASNYEDNGEWQTLKMTNTKELESFTCCPGKTYASVTFKLEIKRLPLFYFVNLVVPCLLISAMSLVGFLLPCNSGEKVSLGITVLLSLTVFMLVVAENMPATGNDIPLLSRFYIITIMLVSISTIMTVFVLNCHHRQSPLPRWMQIVFLQFLARTLCLHVHVSNIQRSNSKRNYEPITQTIYTDMDMGPHDDPIDMASREKRLNGTRNIRLSALDASTDPMCREMLRHLRFLVDHFSEKEKTDQLISDWQLVASVLDRFFMWIYIVCIVIIDAVIFTQMLNA
ncbi:acetylcholine receptor subunit alpha-like 1 [Anneissia japonica]|uniref:acetylcholine receptor subunit alpha-like 1 n=1 Tax=Anneissia japonica TaxID=1529436 RepID=UPI001425A8EC|nr:acetylcholine receptor subunit alpha-like 1 [Anneissia japonica]